MLLCTQIDDVIERALAEDLANGDVTSEAVIDADARGIARALAKEPLVVCGGDVFARVFYRIDPGVRVERLKAEGTRANAGEALWLAEGSTRALLAAERTALNFAQRLSGIATLTARFVAAVPEGSGLRIVDTRKTTPGLRSLERFAVRTGGGRNHRNDLGGAVLIKDNHIAAAGGVAEAVALAKTRAAHVTRVEVEVESLADLALALAAGAEVVLLDNFQPGELAEAVRLAKGRALVEVSGGVTLDRIGEIARAGVDVVSIGALTHSAPAADISLELERLG